MAKRISTGRWRIADVRNDWLDLKVEYWPSSHGFYVLFPERGHVRWSELKARGCRLVRKIEMGAD